MRLTIPALLLVLSNIGCGTLQQSFDSSFDKSFRESCRTSAMKSPNVTQAMADQYCECALAKFKETKSMEKSSAACIEQLKSSLKPQQR
jgi:hypothetical protein